MNNNNSDDFLKGFSAVDSEDRIDRIDPTKEDPNRPEPTLGDRSRITILKTIFQITHTRRILLSNQEMPQMSA